MRHGFVRLAAIAVFAVVSGCGGGGTTSPTSTAAAEAPAAESSGPSDPGTEASVPEVATDAPAGGGGGGSAAGVCELVTAAELAGIFGVASVQTSVIPGPPDTCIVKSDTGDGLGAWSLTTAQSDAIFGALTTDPSTIEVSGLGDK